MENSASLFTSFSSWVFIDGYCIYLG